MFDRTTLMFSSVLEKFGEVVQRFSITLVEELIEDFWSERGHRLETIVSWKFGNLGITWS